MTDHKFIFSNHFCKLTPMILATASGFNHLSISPNFDGTFFFSKQLIGSAISFYRSSLKSNFGYYSVLHVKGIGFKVFYFGRTHSLYFSLGYNHIVKYNLPSTIAVRVRKQYLLFFSSSKSTLGTCIYQVQHLRYPDPYRGKGIRFRFQIMAFKAGKQR